MFCCTTLIREDTINYDDGTISYTALSMLTCSR